MSAAASAATLWISSHLCAWKLAHQLALPDKLAQHFKNVLSNRCIIKLIKLWLMGCARDACLRYTVVYIMYRLGLLLWATMNGRAQHPEAFPCFYLMVCARGNLCTGYQHDMIYAFVWVCYVVSTGKLYISANIYEPCVYMENIYTHAKYAHGILNWFRLLAALLGVYRDMRRTAQI